MADESLVQPLSIQQQGVWIVEKLGFPSALYNITHAVRIAGPLDVEALRASLDFVVQRHDSLRTAFFDDNGTPMRRIEPQQRCDFAVVAVDETAAQTRAQRLESVLQQEVERPFDLATPGLFRARLYRLAPHEHVLLWVVHHIVADGWSLGLVGQEIRALYRDFAQGHMPSLPARATPYGQFVAEQRAWLSSTDFARELEFWTKRMRGVESVAIVGDRPRTARASHRGALHRFIVPAPLKQRLDALAKSERVTLYILLVAAFKTLLRRYTGQNEIVVGTPYGARTDKQLADVCGFFTNTLPLRSTLDGNPTFRDVLRNVRNTVAEALAHRRLPSDMLVNELGLPRDLGVHPLYPVAFALQSLPEVLLQLDGLECSAVPTHTRTAKAELWVSMTEWQGTLQGEIEYSTDLFDEATIAAFAAHFQTLLASIVEDPQQPIARLELLTPDDRRRLLSDWNDTRRDYDLAQSVHERFERHASETPTRVAARLGTRSISYDELNRRANRIAAWLRAQEVGTGSVVAVCMRRSFELLASLLAVHKAGAAFVPLDPEYPRERLRYQVEDSGAQIVLTQKQVANEFDGGVWNPSMPALAVDGADSDLQSYSDANLGVRLEPEQLAYVIYTSGSAGKPKGAMIPSRGLVNHTVWVSETMALTANDRVLHQTSIGFDASLWEIFAPLASGATVVLAPPTRHRDPVDIVALLRAESVSAAFFIPSMLAALLEVPAIRHCATLRFIMCGGEVLEPALVRESNARLPHTKLGNFYGPTEASDDATCYLIESLEPDARSVPIGRPIANAICRVLDRDRALVPVGAVGELCIGGVGVGLGYRNLPELTAARFIPDPYSTDGRLYCTGDLVRYRRDGLLEYVGRLDAQLKIRGMRVELGEVEAVLGAVRGVERCLVVARDRDHGSPMLVAYVSGANLTPEVMRAQIAKSLPDHMVPASIVVIDHWPLLPNGKVDRSALPVPTQSAEIEFVPPRSPIEHVLAAIWSEVLQRPRVGIHDNFFELGGHSLLATQVLARVRRQLQIDVPLRSMFEMPTIAAQSSTIQTLLNGGRTATEPEVAPRSRAEPIPVSFSQRRMWFVQQFEPQGSAYNMPFAMRLTGPLDRAALHSAMRDLGARHEAFRTTFTVVRDEPMQVISAAPQIDLQEVDLRPHAASERVTRAVMLLRDNATAPFDLARGPLTRVCIVQLGDDDHILQLVVHHAVSDQWSAGIVARELAEHYHALREGRNPGLPPLDIQYADYAAWQREALTAQALEPQLDYWRSRLAGIVPLALATDFPRPKRQTFSGSHVDVTLSPELLASLRRLSASRGASLFMTLLAAFKLLLARHSGQQDIAVGTPIANRTHLVTESLVGTLVNTLVMRTQLKAEWTFEELLASVRATALEAFANQDVPFERLVEEFAESRDTSVSPIVQVLFNVVNAPMARPQLAGLTVEPFDFDSGASQFDLSLTVDTEISGRAFLVFSTALYSRASAQRMLDQYVRLLTALTVEPERAISSHSLLSAEERRRLVLDWNGTQRDYPLDSRTDELIREQAKCTPQALAVVQGSEHLTYRDLDVRATQLAHWLRGRGIGRGATVGVLLDRKPQMLVALLATMKSGAAYVPLDPAFPRERLMFMARDAGLQCVLTEAAYVEWLGSTAPSFVLDDVAAQWPAYTDEPLADSATNDDLVYVLYTSGSTGQPKGVEITHRALTNFLLSMQREPGCGAQDRILALTTLSFDIAGLELYLPLLVGGTVELATRSEMADGRLLRRRLEVSKPTIVQATPATWRMLIEAGWSGSRALTVLSGGEALPSDLAEALLARCARLWNLYGPTETTIWSTAARIERASDITIGRPIANTSVYILDIHGQPAPVGVPGEICIGGDGVARGYRGRPELTAERFVNSTFARDGQRRLYRTGDLGRYLEDGRLVHLGRMDSQIKLRGFRVELGEIEAALVAHPDVARAALGTRGTGLDQRLVAWVVMREQATFDENALREMLRKRLPEYMVPAAIVAVPELRLTANNKVDVRALPDPTPAASSGERRRVEPSGLLEVQLASIWSQVLANDSIGVDDDFFALGGHSLKAVELLTQVEKVTGRSLPLATLFEAPTIASMARLLTQTGWNPRWRSLVAIQPLGNATPLFAVPGAGGNVLVFAQLARLLGKEQPLYGLQAIGLDGVAKPFDSIERAARLAVEEIRSVQPQGPYFIMGTCTGGVLAYEIATQLRAAGCVVALAIVESWHPNSYRRPVLPFRALWPLLFVGKRLAQYTAELSDLPFSRWPQFIRTKFVAALALVRRGLRRRPPTATERIEHVTAATMAAVAKYSPEPLAVTLLNVVASDRFVESRETDTRRRWETLVSGASQFHQIPASDSGQLFVSPNVEQLAPLLHRFAQRALPQPATLERELVTPDR